MEFSKRDKEVLWETLLTRMRQQGLDPNDYPSVHRRIEFEYLNLCTIINWMHKLLPQRYESASSTKRTTKILLIIISLLVIAVFALAWYSYQQNVHSVRIHDLAVKYYNQNVEYQDNLETQNRKIMDLIRERNDTSINSLVTTEWQTIIGKGLCNYVSHIDEQYITVAVDGRSITVPHKLTDNDLSQLKKSVSEAANLKIK